jgi:pyruvate dehydrogenase E1 component alpha subunit
VLDPDGRITDSEAVSGIDLKDLYKQMVAARALDVRLSRSGLPAWASAAGEESVAAAIASRLDPHDWVFPGHRDAAISFLRGLPAEELARQITGNTGAETGGRGPRGQLSSTEARVAPATESLGQHLALAAGHAHGQRLAGHGQITVAVVGEGSTTTGAFHEAVALAVAGDLPLVLICKSQVWPEGAPAEAGLLGDNVSDRVRPLGLWSRRTDGADAPAVTRTIGLAVERARENRGPSLVEVVVTQLHHDPPAHRDPVERLRRHLDTAGEWTQTFQDVVEAEARGRLDKAFRALAQETETP